jgi:hypothetical protein
MILRDKLRVNALLQNDCCLSFCSTVGLGLDRNRAIDFGLSLSRSFPCDKLCPLAK